VENLRGIHRITHCGGRRIEHSAYILKTDVAVRHVLEMIVRVITRDIGGRDLVQFCAPMHHHVAVNSPIAQSKFVIEKRIASPPHKIEPITPTLVLGKFCGTGNPPFIARGIACTHARKYTCIDGNNARDAIRHSIRRIEIPREAKLLSVDSRVRSFFLFALISLRIVSYRWTLSTN